MMGQEKVAVFRKAHFNAAHRLHVEGWSEQENDRVFGKCNNPHFHGHNYELVVKVTGPVDPVTGFVVDLKWLNDIIQQEIIHRFDHKNLNLDTQEFRTLIPTAENIAIVIYRLLRPHVDLALNIQVRLYETERNFVEFPVA
ncbi:6-pyruvoyl trahydropterin synthase family protein [Arachidicoccus terrestris]|uniref:6-pyruvoyl trahydropterin synthase family protein n=1 Tax=Arachidicoccus terrestris TaxID=2875539 RepID=UPI001CC4BBD6|nr:6-carboxytetrahydropterin synthase [Arachidicoccus terrestris]